MTNYLKAQLLTFGIFVLSISLSFSMEKPTGSDIKTLVSIYNNTHREIKIRFTPLKNMQETLFEVTLAPTQLKYPNKNLSKDDKNRYPGYVIVDGEHTFSYPSSIAIDNKNFGILYTDTVAGTPRSYEYPS